MTGPRLPVATDDWAELRRTTDARIALGRSGAGLPTAAHLAFQAAHAQARDAVHAPLDGGGLKAEFEAKGLPAILVASAAEDRSTYLKRPDLGRRLSDDSRRMLSEAMPPCDVALVVADGLSSTAVHGNALPTLSALVPLLRQGGKRISPIIIATQARVALADEIGGLLNADVAIILIGERPGLSAVDSLGIYVTWMPRIGRTDAERNCISNIRAGGLDPEQAARQARDLVDRMILHRAAGVALAKPTLGHPAPGEVEGQLADQNHHDH